MGISSNYIVQLVNVMIIVFIMTSLSCSYQPEISSSAVTLNFSADTLSFDTIFTNRQSVSKRLWVRNPSTKAIALNEISLNNPNFELIVNGRSGNRFQDEIIYGSDSILVLVEAKIDATDQNNPFIIRESLSFSNNGLQQSIPVQAWGQNAQYIKNDTLECNTRWLADKPIVLMGNIVVNQDCELHIEAGSRIYSAPNTFLIIKGTLKAEGKADSLIQFTNDRLDAPFKSAPGQWGGIVITDNSNSHEMSYVDIRNSRVGINAIGGNTFSPEIILSNSKVGNISGSAILALNALIEAENCLFYETTNATVAHIGGGFASYNYCTIANYFNTSREESALVVSDAAVDNDGNQIINTIDCTIKNSIVYGRRAEELTFLSSSEDNVSLSIENNLLRTTQNFLENIGNSINEDPVFLEPFNLNYQLGASSPAIDQGKNPTVTIDIRATSRDSLPDIGAFEFIPKKDEN